MKVLGAAAVVMILTGCGLTIWAAQTVKAKAGEWGFTFDI